MHRLLIFYFLEAIPAIRYYSSRPSFSHPLLWGNRYYRGYGLSFPNQILQKVELYPQCHAKALEASNLLAIFPQLSLNL